MAAAAISGGGACVASSFRAAPGASARQSFTVKMLLLAEHPVSWA